MCHWRLFNGCHPSDIMTVEIHVSRRRSKTSSNLCLINRKCLLSWCNAVDQISGMSLAIWTTIWMPCSNCTIFKTWMERTVITAWKIRCNRDITATDDCLSMCSVSSECAGQVVTFFWKLCSTSQSWACWSPTATFTTSCFLLILFLQSSSPLFFNKATLRRRDSKGREHVTSKFIRK